MIERVVYRLRQFFRALLAPFAREDLDEVERFLTPPQWALFRRMSPADRRHGVAVYRALRAVRVQQADLLTAALLHDVGKCAVPLLLPVRVTGVLLQRFAPHLWQQLGTKARGWRRPFALYQRHAATGAAWAAEAGCSPTTVRLIRNHEKPPGDDDLLLLLRQADERS